MVISRKQDLPLIAKEDQFPEKQGLFCVYVAYSISSCFIELTFVSSVGPGLSCLDFILSTLKGDC